MQFRKRQSLVAAILLGQLVCLSAGGVWFCGWLDRAIGRLNQQQVLRDNQLLAMQFATLIAQMRLERVDYGTDDWLRLQQAVEELKLPNDGFVCITRNPGGELLCHPRLQQNPAMREMKPGLANLETSGATGPILKLARAQGRVSGRALMQDGIHLIAAERIPELGVNVMVHQRESRIRSAISRITTPIYRIGIIVVLAIVGLTAIISVSLMRRYESRLSTVNVRLEETVRQRTQSLVKTRNATIFGLAKLAESRDTDTGDHLDRIRKYVSLLATDMSAADATIDKAFIDDLTLASSLHDIGKVGIPDSILLKPGPLTPDERTIVERHAEIGGNCLAEIERHLGEDDFLQVARQIAFSHHERWDGNGYPYKLRGEQIPLAARIVAVADVYDALTSKRPYKKAMDHDTASRIIIEGSGTQFDPRVVEAFENQSHIFEACVCAREDEHLQELPATTFEAEPQLLETAPMG